MSFHPGQAVFGFCFLFIAIVSFVAGPELDGDTVWLWAAAFGGVGLAGVTAVLLAIVQRRRGGSVEG